MCYPTNDFEWYQFKPWNLESKLHFGTWLSDDEFDNMIYQIVSKLFYEVYENRLEICYKVYNELDDVKPFIMLETLNEVTIMKIDQ